MCRHSRKRRRIAVRIHGATMATIPILILTKQCPPQVHATDVSAVTVNPLLCAMPQSARRTNGYRDRLPRVNCPPLIAGRYSETRDSLHHNHETRWRPGKTGRKQERPVPRAQYRDLRTMSTRTNLRKSMDAFNVTTLPCPLTDLSERHIQYRNDPVDLLCRDDEGGREGNHAFEARHSRAVLTHDDPVLLRRRDHAVHLLGG